MVEKEVKELAEQQKELIRLRDNRDIGRSEFLDRYRKLQNDIWETLGKRCNKEMEIKECQKQMQM